MADWLGINSTNKLSVCGEDVGYELNKALDGTGVWYHSAATPHQFVLDLGYTYYIQRVRGRSITTGCDPINVEIYVAENLLDYGDAVATTDHWCNTNDWVEVVTTAKLGRYIKIVITTTEHKSGFLHFGRDLPVAPITIFDAYADKGPGNPRDPEDIGWKIVSLPVNSTILKENTFYLYNGTYYTFTQATTNDNETGAPLILQFLYGWDYSEQYYTTSEIFEPYLGYWQYYYKNCQLYYPTNGAETGANMEILPGKMISIKI